MYFQIEHIFRKVQYCHLLEIIYNSVLTGQLCRNHMIFRHVQTGFVGGKSDGIDDKSGITPSLNIVGHSHSIISSIRYMQFINNAYRPCFLVCLHVTALLRLWCVSHDTGAWLWGRCRIMLNKVSPQSCTNKI